MIVFSNANYVFNLILMIYYNPPLQAIVVPVQFREYETGLFW